MSAARIFSAIDAEDLPYDKCYICQRRRDEHERGRVVDHDFQLAVELPENDYRKLQQGEQR